jgi:transcription elongation factor/antiterminator RfaH
MRNWYLIYTKPRQEDRVGGRLVEKGISVLNPKLRQRKVIRRAVRDAVSPLFPCYVFARFDCPRDFRLVKYTWGVRDVVGADYTPSIVPDTIIDDISRRLTDGVVNMECERFREGAEVRVKAGAFEGFSAVFERELKGPERVSILLKAMNVRIVLDAAMLEEIA